MDLNGIFFPAPKITYSCLTYFGELIYLPKTYGIHQGEKVAKLMQDGLNTIYIPCLLI